MKKFINKLFGKLIKKAVNKSINDVVNNPEVPEVEPITIPGDNSKKSIWKFIIQVVISILTALAAALTTTSCVNHF